MSTRACDDDDDGGGDDDDDDDGGGGDDIAAELSIRSSAQVTFSPFIDPPLPGRHYKRAIKSKPSFTDNSVEIYPEIR